MFIRRISPAASDPDKFGVAAPKCASICRQLHARDRNAGNWDVLVNPRHISRNGVRRVKRQIGRRIWPASLASGIRRSRTMRRKTKMPKRQPKRYEKQQHRNDPGDQPVCPCSPLLSSSASRFFFGPLGIDHQRLRVGVDRLLIDHNLFHTLGARQFEHGV